MSDISLYVVDSSVFNKLYLDEPGRDKAITLFTQAAYREITLIAPTLLFYEVVHTSQYYQLPVQKVIELLKKQEQRNLHLIEPTLQHTEKALDIIQMGHPQEWLSFDL